MGWYGLCNECESFSLKQSEMRDKIWKVWQTTSDHKSYIRFDATVPSFFDNIPNFQDFTELKCGYSYKIIMKKNTLEAPRYIDIPNFVYTHDDMLPSGLITDNCFTLPSTPTVTNGPFVDLVVRAEKQPEYAEDTFDIIISNKGDTASTGEEVHQFFKKIITSSTSSFLLSTDTLFEIITSGVPTSNQILIENFDELNAIIIDSNQLKFNSPILPDQEIYIKVKLNPFVPFISKVDSDNVIDEKNTQLVDAEANNIVIVDAEPKYTPTPTDFISPSEFFFGVRENKTGGVAENPTWLLGPSSFSIEKLPILNLGNGVVRIYVNEKLISGTETGKVDWIALPDEESDAMTENIVLGANYNEVENTIVNKITSSQKISSMANIVSGEFNSIGWFINFDSSDSLPDGFLSPTKVSVEGQTFYLQKINQSWLLTDVDKNQITSEGPTAGVLLYERGTQIQVESSHPAWKINIGTRVVLPITGGGEFYTITDKTDNDTFIIDGTFGDLSEKYIAIDVPSFLLNTHNYMVSPGFQTTDEYKYWVTTGVGASWTNHPKEPGLNRYIIEYIEFNHQLFNRLFQ
jgi:hypothetical protein